ncbi:polysaccharide pyruvyl transferase family protein [Rhizobium rhizogenes]|uniref:polysaccharide pyruvyl transferase family protein n=1 Tax=Rhizobium rhizogenes TaxID=359 RepID=UPI0015741F7E|nr:polysaccharide pyruvyl transferase family protein [Rhizobium rhizogenes]NTF42799.1 polysaccharide pyruvyl transferase family protein [Rhizobium rhizogenes]
MGTQSISDSVVSDKEFLLQRLGGNSGNMLFTESLLRTIVGGSWHPADSVNYGEADSIVIAAANWLSPIMDFSWLADIVEKTDLPVFLVGVGAQSDLSYSVPDIHAGTLRLLNIISERSKLISTRGRFSSEVLEYYGIKNSSPTGCPSLLLCGAEGPRFSSKGLGPQVVLHGTRHGIQGTDDFQNFLYRQAYKHGTGILLQSERADLHVAFGDDPFDIDLDVAHMLGVTYGAPGYQELIDYLRNKAAFFHNLDDWFAYCKTKDFFVGTRIHGTIMSLIAGTPAILIAHDARTAELAQTLNIPYVLSSQIDTDNDLDFARLYETFDSNDLGVSYQKYRNNFLDFFEANDLPAS